MSKASQRRLSDKQAREKAQKGRRRMLVPLAARGVIFERKNFEAAHKAHLGMTEVSPQFEAEVSLWEGSPNKEQFFVFIRRIDGREICMWPSSVEVLREYLRQILSEFSARKFVCMISPGAISEPLNTELTELVGQHAIDVSATAPAPNVDCQKGLEIRRLQDPAVGDVLIVQIDCQLVRSQDVCGFLRLLDNYVHDASELKRNWMKLRISFNGYDKDPREVYEIPEVRSFMKTVVEQTPWFLCLVSPAEYLVWFGATCELDKVEKQGISGQTTAVRFAPNALEIAVEFALQNIGPLIRCAGLGESSEDLREMTESLTVSLGSFMTGMNMSAHDPVYRPRPERGA